MKIKNVLATSLVLISLISHGRSQGFINLDFESAKIIIDGYLLSVPDAFPGWIINAPYVIYDSASLSGNSISIYDTTPPYGVPAIQGAYSVFLASGNTPGLGQTISLGQTGTIPVGTQSILFWGDLGGLQITFDDQLLAFSETGSTANYSVYAADISAFAGQTGQLLFSLPPYVRSATLDNIQFSPSPIPEPGVHALLALGSVAFMGWRRFSRRKL